MNYRHVRVLIFWIFLFLLPTQFGKHFFFDFSFVNGVRVDYLAPALYVTDLLFALLLIAHLRDIINHLRKNIRWIGALIILIMLNVFIANEPVLAAYSTGRIIQIYLTYVIFRHYSHNAYGSPFVPLIAGALLQLALTSAQLVFNSALQGPFYYLGERALSISTPGAAKADLFGNQFLRPYGTFSHPNSLGGFYLLVGVYALSGTFKKTAGMFRKMAGTLLLALSTMLVLISFSKAAILSLAAAIIIFAVAKKVRIKECSMCTLAKTIIGSVLLAIFLQVRSDPLSLEKRMSLMREALVIITQKPFFGTGFGNYLYHHTQFPSQYLHFFLQPVHNIFILFVMQAGIILTGFVLYTLVPFAARLISKRGMHAILPCMVVLLTGLADHYWLTLHQNMLILGVIFGLVASDVSEKHKGKKSSQRAAE